MKQVNIALLGFGTVGTGVWDIVNMNQERLSLQTNTRINISKILVLDKTGIKHRKISKGILTEDYHDILQDSNIQIVVEVTGTAEIAFDFMMHALKAGKHVVTANKYVISRWGKTLFKYAHECNCALYYEATVGGGMPIIREMTEGLAANEINYFAGILNGTTNYILHKMKTAQITYQEALSAAQSSGYAEADPTGDIKGYDVANKLAILAMLGFNLDINPEKIDCIGIECVTLEDIKKADALGYNIKLLAYAKRDVSNISLAVYPALVSKYSKLGQIEDAFNGIVIKGNAVEDIFLYGKGAGALPTGSAIVGDIISIINQGDYPLNFNLFKRYKEHKSIQSARMSSGNFYININSIEIERIQSIINAFNINIMSNTDNFDGAIIVSISKYEEIESIIQAFNQEKIDVLNVFKVENEV